jgi:hypothetical protein
MKTFLSLLPIFAVACLLVSTRDVHPASEGPAPAPATAPAPPTPTEVATPPNDPAEVHAELCLPDDLHPGCANARDLDGRRSAALDIGRLEQAGR